MLSSPDHEHPRRLLQRLPKYLTQAQVTALFSVIAAARDRALFALIYHYGLRVQEVGLIERGDVDFDRHRIVIKRVKGGLWLEQPLFSATEGLLKNYIRHTPGACVALFPGQAGALKKRRIQALFSQYRGAAGLPSYLTCHSLRHAIATHLLDAGLPLEFVQDHLGHRSIRSTSIYARITDRHRASAFERLERSPWIVQPRPKRRKPR